MKLLLECLVAIFLHPLAAILAWIDILKRQDLTIVKKILWMVLSLIWGIGPILYLVLSNGNLW